jgi:hypothetical protein
MFAGAFELCAEAPLGTGASSASGARVHAEDAPAKGLERGRGGDESLICLICFMAVIKMKGLELKVNIYIYIHCMYIYIVDIYIYSIYIYI